MKSQVLLTLSLGMSVAAFAQDKYAKKYAAIITPELAKKHLSILASDEFEGRETGKPGAEKAAQYLKEQYKSLGLTGPVNGDYFLKLDMYEKTVTARNVLANNKQLEENKDFSRLNWNGAKTTFTNFVFVGYGVTGPKYDDLTAANVAGKVMIVLPGDPQVNGNYLTTGTATALPANSMRMKTAALNAKKPAFIINVLPAGGAQGAGGFGGRGGFGNAPQLVMGKTGNPNQVGSVYLSAEAVNQLLASTGKTVESIQKEIADSGKPAPVSFTSSLSVDVQADFKPVDVKDVMGFMEGSDPKLKKEILVFSAHYDHIGLVTNPNATDKVNNGADDDGSGTTGIVEIATAFAQAKKEGHGPKRSILWLSNVGEEKGLLGSEWYVDHPVFPLENTITDLNIDMIGRVGEEYKGKPDSANYVYVIGSAMLSSKLRQVSEEANKTYMNMTTDYKYDDPADPNRFYYRSDHYNFAKHNVPIIFYFNGVHEDYHRPGDEVKKINFPLLAKRAQLAFYTGWMLANMPERPAVDAKSPMSNDR